MKKCYLAIDLGASSGRHVVSWIENGKIVTEEVYRFDNDMEIVNGECHWNTEKVFFEILFGIKKSIEKFGKIESLAIDSWGVDYALLNGDKLISPVYAYRSNRTKIAINKVHRIIPIQKLYELTGEQFQPYNTIYQLYSDKLSGRLENATDFLMIPEYFTYLLTGKKVKEYTNATTGALVNIKTKEFDGEIINALNLPERLFKPLHFAGETVGDLLPEVQERVGGNVTVKLCASHDTACAYEAVEAEENSVIISSGTWSLVGVKIKNPCVSESSFKNNFANEGGVGYYRYLKNVMGMWIPNSCCKEFGISIAEAVKIARKSTYTKTFDVNDMSLNSPKSMVLAVENLLNLVLDEKDLFSSIFHSLAACYASTIAEIERNLEILVEKIYIVGGGAKNEYLNELTENYCNKKVVALPIEATAIGNIKTQISRKMIMRKVKEQPFLKEFTETLSNMYRLGWDERNGGNVSMMLTEEEVNSCIDANEVLRELDINLQANELIGKYFLATGTGKYFKNVESDPEKNLGIFRIKEDGKTAQLLWGLNDGGKFTSELPAHLMTHMVRLKVDPLHRVVMHCHPTNIIAMTFIHELDEKEFTKSLWRTCTECMVVFPDGVGILPWMLCGTNEIGVETAKKMNEFRLVVWAQHGIYGVGKDLDEAFGLIETVEKGADIFMRVLPYNVKQTITDENLKEIAKAFGVKYKDGWL